MKKMISAALIIAGILLLYFGYQEYQSLSSEVEEFITGSPDSGAMWMLIGGAAATIAGLVGLFYKK
jgi:drug/metabolite transporter (DMT)-like permease